MSDVRDGCILRRDMQKRTHMVKSSLVIMKGREFSYERTRCLIVCIFLSTTGTCWPGPAVSITIPFAMRAGAMVAIAPSPLVSMTTESNPRLDVSNESRGDAFRTSILQGHTK